MPRSWQDTRLAGGTYRDCGLVGLPRPTRKDPTLQDRSLWLQKSLLEGPARRWRLGRVDATRNRTRRRHLFSAYGVDLQGLQVKEAKLKHWSSVVPWKYLRLPPIDDACRLSGSGTLPSRLQAWGGVAAGVRLGVILFGRQDPLEFHCVARSGNPGDGFLSIEIFPWSRCGWVAGKFRHYRTICRSVFDAKLTSQGLTSASNLARRVYSTSA